MPILRKIKRKENGVEETVHLGALAQNITQDATHRFVTDTEKQAWNSKPGSTSGLDNNVVTFTEVATRENLQSGEKLSISFGKIKKWFSDLGAAAFMAVANNCTTTAVGSALDARQGKVLMDKANQLSSDLGGFSFHTDENGHYLQKGDEMYLLQNKPIEISAWYYQVNGGKTELILDVSGYKTLSIGQQDGNGALSIYGKGSSETAISQGSDGYYNVSAYNQIVIRITNNTYVTGTLNSIRLW